MLRQHGPLRCFVPEYVVPVERLQQPQLATHTGARVAERARDCGAECVADSVLDPEREVTCRAISNSYVRGPELTAVLHHESLADENREHGVEVGVVELGAGRSGQLPLELVAGCAGILGGDLGDADDSQEGGGVTEVGVIDEAVEDSPEAAFAPGCHEHENPRQVRGSPC